MFDPKVCFPFQRMCLWLCSGCGGPFWFPQLDGLHGGPTERASDRRYSAPIQGPCWRSKDAGVKCATPKGWRVLYHEGAPNPEQPEQPELAAIEELVAAAAGSRRTRVRSARTT